MIVYFDTNVFDHLEQLNGVTAWEAYRLKRAVRHGCIHVVITYLNIEETLFIVPSQPKRAEARVKLIFELGDRNLVVRGHQDTLNNDFLSYAEGQPLHSPFESLTPWMESELWSFAAPIVRSDLRKLARVIHKTRRIKKEHQDFMAQARKRMKLLVPFMVEGRYPFNDYWKNNSVWLAEGLAKRRKVLGKVMRRGLPGLLKLKSIALAVGMNLSLIYSHHFEGRNPLSGDSRDILHAIAASSADIFVTNDRGLEAVLARIPPDGFQVMNLQAFLNRLPAWV
jgi:hypothetical protein